MWKLNVTVFFSVGALPANSSASGTISVTSPFTMVEDVPIKLTRDRPTYNILLDEVKLSEVTITEEIFHTLILQIYFAPLLLTCLLVHICTLPSKLNYTSCH